LVRGKKSNDFKVALHKTFDVANSKVFELLLLLISPKMPPPFAAAVSALFEGLISIFSISPIVGSYFAQLPIKIVRKIRQNLKN
jgi:hypothetical protein